MPLAFRSGVGWLVPVYDLRGGMLLDFLFLYLGRLDQSPNCVAGLIGGYREDMPKG